MSRDIVAYKTQKSALSGTSWVEIVSAPPDGVAYRVFHWNLLNSSGGTRTYKVRVNDGTNTSEIWALVAFGGVVIFQETTDAHTTYPVVVLSDTTHTLEMQSSGTDAGTVIASYEVHRALID